MVALENGGFGTPTRDDRRPWLWVAMIVSCGYSVLTLVVRLFSKWGHLGIEDVILAVAYACATVNWGLIDCSILEGLGQSSPRHTAEASEYFFTSQVLLLGSIYLSKISVLWFARRIFVTGARRESSVLFKVGLVVISFCGVASIALFSAACDFEATLRSPGQCPSLQTRLIVIAVLDALTELILVAIPAYLISQNTIDRSKKLKVNMLFGFRLVNIAFMAGLVTSYRSIITGGPNGTDAATVAGVWSQVVLGYSLISASIPCIRSFLSAFLADGIYRVYDTQFFSSTAGSRYAVGASAGYGSDLQPSNSHVAQRRGKGMASGVDSISKGPVRSGGREETDSVASDASRRMMIERTVDLQVVSEQVSIGRAKTTFPYQGSRSQGF